MTTAPNLTDNFLLFFSNNGPAALDWFDDAFWERAIGNVELLSMQHDQGRFRSIFFDPELYYAKTTTNPYTYDEAYFPAYSIAEVQAKVRQRGAQFIAALQSHKHDVRVLAFFLVSQPDAVFSENAPYGLLPTFLDGMLDTAGPLAVIIDGQEDAYYMNETPMYMEGWWLDDANKGFSGISAVRSQARKLLSPENQGKIDRQLQIGEGLYLNIVFGILGYHYVLPLAYRQAWWEHNVYHSLLTADEYVWCYSYFVDWWPGDGQAGMPLPPRALDLMQSARDKLAAGLPFGVFMASSSAPGLPSHQSAILTEPEIAIKRPVHNGSCSAGGMVNVLVTGQGNGIARVVLYVNSVEAGRATALPATITISNVPEQGLTLVARGLYRRGFAYNLQSCFSAVPLVSRFDQGFTS